MGDLHSQEAEQAFREALDIDPGYAPAWTGLSVVLRDQANRGEIDLHDGTRQARAAAVRALELDPELPEAWSALAHIEFHYDWDWDRALGTVRTALQYAPNNIDALLVLAQMLEGLGRVEEAIEAAEKAFSLDPLNRQSIRRLALVQWAAGRYAEAEATTRRLWELHPDSANAPMLIGALLNLQGKPEEALPYVEQGKDEFWRTFALALVYHSLGRKDDADRTLNHLIEEFGYFGAFQVAIVYAWRGQVEEAFEWLDISYRQRDGGFNTILVDPALRSLHDDPRWEPMLNRIGLLPYWQAMQAKAKGASS